MRADFSGGEAIDWVGGERVAVCAGLIRGLTRGKESECRNTDFGGHTGIQRVLLGKKSGNFRWEVGVEQRQLAYLNKGEKIRRG